MLLVYTDDVLIISHQTDSIADEIDRHLLPRYGTCCFRLDRFFEGLLMCLPMTFFWFLPGGTLFPISSVQ